MENPALDLGEKDGSVVGLGHLGAAAAFDLDRLAEELPSEILGFGPGLTGEHGGRSGSGEFGVDLGDQVAAGPDAGEGVACRGVAGAQAFDGAGELSIGEGPLDERTGVEGDLSAARVDAASSELLSEAGGVAADVGLEEQLNAPVCGCG